MQSASSFDNKNKVQNIDTSRPTTATVKNPLLSAAVTGLTFDDFTHNAVLLPAANPVVPAAAMPTNNQSPNISTTGTGRNQLPDNDERMKEKYKVKSVVFGGYEPVAILDTESFSEINLNQTTEATTTTSGSSFNRGDLRGTDYNPLQNLDEPLLSDLQQQELNTNKLESAFSPLLQQTNALTAQLSQLPSVASSVLTSFSNILRGTSSPEVTTGNVTTEPDQANTGNIDYLNDIPLNYHQQFIGGAINEQQQQQQQQSNVTEQVIEPPKFYSPTDSVFIGSTLPPPSSSSSSSVNAQGTIDNHYRISAKKKIYAAVPGLNATTGQNLPPPPAAAAASSSSLPPLSETGNYFNNNNNNNNFPSIQPTVGSTIQPPPPPPELSTHSLNPYFTDNPQQSIQPTTNPTTINSTTINNNNNKFSLSSFFQTTTPLVNKLQSTINQNFTNFTEPTAKSIESTDEIFSISTITSEIPQISSGYQQQQQPSPNPPPPSLINPNLFKTKIQSTTQQTPIINNTFNPINQQISPPKTIENPPGIVPAAPINFYQQNTSSIPSAPAAPPAAAFPSSVFVNNSLTTEPPPIVSNQFVSSPSEQILLNSQLPPPTAATIGPPPISGSSSKNTYRLNKRIPLYKSNLTATSIQPSFNTTNVQSQPQPQPKPQPPTPFFPTIPNSDRSSIINSSQTLLNPESESAVVSNNLSSDTYVNQKIFQSNQQQSSKITNVNLFVPNVETSASSSSLSQNHYQAPSDPNLFYDSSKIIKTTTQQNQNPLINQGIFPVDISQQQQQLVNDDDLSIQTSIETTIINHPSNDQILPDSKVNFSSSVQSKDPIYFVDNNNFSSSTIQTNNLLQETSTTPSSNNFFDIQKPPPPIQETDKFDKNKPLITDWFNQQQQQQPQQIQSTDGSSPSTTGIRQSSTTPFKPIEIFPLTSASPSHTEKPILNPITTSVDPINFFNNQLLQSTDSSKIPPLITDKNSITASTEISSSSVGQPQQQQPLVDNQSNSILQNIFNNQPASSSEPPSELNELNIVNKRLQNIQLFNSSGGGGGSSGEGSLIATAGGGSNNNLSFTSPSEVYSFASNLVEPPSSTQSEFSELADLSSAGTQFTIADEITNEQLSNQLQIDAQKYFDRIDAEQSNNTEFYDIIKMESIKSNELSDEVGVAGSGGITIQNSIYRPIYKHWFYQKIIDTKSIFWSPFSMADSMNLEEAFVQQDRETIETDGGRFDVNIGLRQKTPIYWNEKPNVVRRCSWFYKGIDSRYIPYEEEFADKLEKEYQEAFVTGEWNRKISLANGEKVVFHSASVMVHFLNSQFNDTDAHWSAPSGPQLPNRPRMVKRGVDEFNIDDGEPEQVDHLLFMVHGIGAACDFQFRTVEEVVDEFRSNAMQLVQSHYRSASDNGTVGRIEVLPISWHGELHSTESGIDEKLKAITLESIPKLRSFTNDTLLDVLFYTSPVFCQQIMDSVSGSLNRLYSKYCERNPTFHGDISLAGHSLGSLILFDLLQHQQQQPTIPDDTIIALSKKNIDQKQKNDDDDDNNKNDKCMIGTAGTGQPSIEYPNLIFKPKNFFALGSPIGMFVTIRGINGLGPDFKLPTTEGFYNIFHPYDPVAYRIEALINSELSAIRPVLIPHHKGRKRMHLELREAMTRVGSDIKQMFVDTFRHALGKVHSFRMPNNKAVVTKAIEQEVDKVLEEQMNMDKDQEGTTNSSSSPIIEIDIGETDIPLGILNKGKRIDYVLQEAPLEFFNEYLFALTSHVCYWESEDTTLFIIKEIYSSLGIKPDSTITTATTTTTTNTDN